MPIFHTRAEILEIHDYMIEQFGGTYGVRDEGLLDSALAMPEAGIGDQYFHVDDYEKAAAYLYHIVQNHPFHDGNKRVGAMAAIIYLDLNGYDLSATEDEIENLTFAVARGEKDKSEIAEFFRRHTEQTDQ